MTKFITLLAKDIKQHRFLIFLLPLLQIGFVIYLRSRSDLWQSSMPVGFFLALIPLLIVPPFVLFAAYNSLRQEWQTKSIYLLGTLPVSGFMHMTSKLFAVMCLVLVFLLVFFLSGILALDMSLLNYVLPQEVLEEKGFILGELVKLLVLYFFFQGVLAVLAQTSYILGRMTPRLQGLLSALVFIGLVWVLGEFVNVMTPLLHWFPDIPLGFTVVQGTIVEQTYLHLAGPGALALGTLIIHLISGYILEWRIDY